jgi:hypothetical protein
MNPMKHFFNLTFWVASIRLTWLMKKSHQFTWCTPVHLVRLKELARARSSRWSGWCHVISVTSVKSMRLMLKSRQFIRRVSVLWLPCSLYFSFLLFTFFSFYVLSPPRSGSLGDSYFNPQIIPRGILNRFHELVFQSCWVRTSSSPSHFLVFRK